MSSNPLPAADARAPLLEERRRRKMARSVHAYVRGSTAKFYEWLETRSRAAVPEGPSVWICGDCHLGNLGPVANVQGEVEIEIRDLDQTVVGNPAHDLIRLALSLATAARSSDLPGVVTARMVEEMVAGYADALGAEDDAAPVEEPEAVRLAMKRALGRRWRHLAAERIGDTKPSIPLGSRFWPLSEAERTALEALFRKGGVRKLAASLHDRGAAHTAQLLDAAYWVKGCSSLGRLRYAALVRVEAADGQGHRDCLIDLKGAVAAAAPSRPEAEIPRDNAERVVEGALHLSPYIGERMLAQRLMGQAVVLRELMPQDLKLEIEALTPAQAVASARYLAGVVGAAHGRQLDPQTRAAWKKTLEQRHMKTLDAPSWLWTGVVELLAIHEAAYLDHCRKYAMAA